MPADQIVNEHPGAGLKKNWQSSDFSSVGDERYDEDQADE